MIEVIYVFLIAIFTGFVVAEITKLIDVMLSKGHILEGVRIKRFSKEIEGLKEWRKEEFANRLKGLESIMFDKQDTEILAFEERNKVYNQLYFDLSLYSKGMMKIVCTTCMGLRYIFPLSIALPIFLYFFLSFFPDFFIIHVITSIAGFNFFINK